MTTRHDVTAHWVSHSCASCVQMKVNSSLEPVPEGVPSIYILLQLLPTETNWDRMTRGDQDTRGTKRGGLTRIPPSFYRYHGNQRPEQYIIIIINRSWNSPQSVSSVVHRPSCEHGFHFSSVSVVTTLWRTLTEASNVEGPRCVPSLTLVDWFVCRLWHKVRKSNLTEMY